MGYAHYTITRKGEEIEAGYGVEDICNHDDCTEEIDRGLYHLCGDRPNSGRGCGKYFCGGHLYLGTVWEGQLCPACAEEAAEEYEREHDMSESSEKA